jgi:hypothetical protein
MVAQASIDVLDTCPNAGKVSNASIASAAAGGACAGHEHVGGGDQLFGLGTAASCACTRDLLDWTPTGPNPVEDILAGGHGAAATELQPLPPLFR